MTAINLAHPDNNPIMIGISENAAMGRWDVELMVGNFKTEHQAKAVANKLIKLVERELGSRRSTAAKAN